MEKRESARYAVELPVSFSGTKAAGGGMTRALSAHGCTVVSDDLVQPQTSVALRIELPGQYAPLKVDLAEVRWVRGQEFGLEFQRLRLEERKRLEQFLGALARAQGGGQKQAG